VGDLTRVDQYKVGPAFLSEGSPFPSAMLVPSKKHFFGSLFFSVTSVFFFYFFPPRMLFPKSPRKRPLTFMSRQLYYIFLRDLLLNHPRISTSLSHSIGLTFNLLSLHFPPFLSFSVGSSYAGPSVYPSVVVVILFFPATSVKLKPQTGRFNSLIAGGAPWIR